MAGRVPMYVASAPELMEHHKTGGIRIIATTDVSAISAVAGDTDLSGKRNRCVGAGLVGGLCPNQDPAAHCRAAQPGHRGNRAGAGYSCAGSLQWATNPPERPLLSSWIFSVPTMIGGGLS